MQRLSNKTNRKQLPTDYVGLMNEQMLHPIHDEVDYENAQAMIDRLTSIPRRSKGQSEYLEALSIFFAAYEAEHHAIDTSDLTPIDMLKHLMQQHDMSGSDLGTLLGDRGLGSKVLQGGRDLSKAHIRKLAAHFNVSPGLFF